MNLDFFNCPSPQEFNFKLLPKERPAFLDYRPDFAAVEAVAKEYADYKNILIVGHGGSITSFYAFYNALKYGAAKQAYFLSTVDPDYIAELRSELSPEDTVVVAISKSGETVTQLEALSQFLDYPLLFITGHGSTLEQIGQKVSARIVPHPPIGGRYTAFTEVALLPALLCGLNVDELFQGAREVYGLYEKDNLAWKAASCLWQLEQQGYVDVFMPFYSHALYPASQLAVQLCHESFGKAGKGQSFMAFEAPESQHHTNQRFFGGIKNICGLFIGVDNFKSSAVSVFPTAVHSISLKSHPLFDINKIPLGAAMGFERAATLEDARLQNIPVLSLSLTSLEAIEVGRFIAFWQLLAVYASLLRGVDPFDQPQVEASKRISFDKRLAYKGLL